MNPKLDRTDNMPITKVKYFDLMRIITSDIDYLEKIRDVFEFLHQHFPNNKLFFLKLENNSFFNEDQITFSTDKNEWKSIFKIISTYEKELLSKKESTRLKYYRNESLIVKPIISDNKVFGILGYSFEFNKYNHATSELFLSTFEFLETELIKDLSFEQKLNELRDSLVEIKIRADENELLISNFLTNMSHEIRTPLNAIIGFSKLLENDVYDNIKRKKFAKFIKDNSEDLMKIIHDIIDISKLESNKITLNKSNFNLNHFLANIQKRYKEEISNEKKDLSIQLSMTKQDKDSFIYSDYAKINQVINNLLSNAIKFTPNGHIEFGYSMNGSNDVLFFVKDNGIGINEEMKTKVFEPFVQEDESISRKYGGNGLGLAICKKIVEKLEGEIWIESTKNVGSTIFFKLNKN